MILGTALLDARCLGAQYHTVLALLAYNADLVEDRLWAPHKFGGSLLGCVPRLYFGIVLERLVVQGQVIDRAFCRVLLQ